MKQVNINGDLIYISDAEYEEMEKRQIIIDSLQEKGGKMKSKRKLESKSQPKKPRKLKEKELKQLKNQK